MSEQILAADLDTLVESPFHRRAHWGDLEAFAAGIKARGILQPIVVRERDNGFQISFGHRRYRGAKLAELATVPVIVREQSDEDVIDAQLVENAEREDAHPMDEAEAYEQLRDRGASLEQLALRFGKEPTYIRQRLKLCALAPKARERFVAGEFDVDCAFLVARIPDAALQAKAAARIAGPCYPRELNHCREYIEREFMLTLRGAPFPIAAVDLVPDAGSCSGCPKNTEALPDLFADIQSKSALCTDAACFHKKTAAGYKRITARAKKAGMTVLSAKDSKPLFVGKSLTNTGYVTPTSKPAGLRKTWKALLGGAAPMLVVAKDGTGAARELYDLKAAKDCAKKAGIDLSPATTSSSSSSKTAKKKGPNEFDPETTLDERQNKVLVETREQLGQLLPLLEFSDRFRALVYTLANALRWAACETAKRRKMAPKGSGSWGALPRKLVAFIEAANVDELAELALDILLGDDATYESWQDHDRGEVPVTQTLLQLLGVDVTGRLARLEEEEVATARAKGYQIKGEKPAAATKAAKKSKAKKSKAKKGGAK